MYSLSCRLLRAHAHHVRPDFISVRTVKLKITPFVSKHETLEQKSRRRCLPISPDLSVYRPQLTTVLSISHRITGLALVAYTTSFALNAMFNPHDFSQVVTMVEGLDLGTATLMAAKFVFVFPFTFHLCSGVRHLLWDTGRYLTINGVYKTGYAAFSGALLVAGLLAVL